MAQNPLNFRNGFKIWSLLTWEEILYMFNQNIAAFDPSLNSPINTPQCSLWVHFFYSVERSQFDADRHISSLKWIKKLFVSSALKGLRQLWWTRTDILWAENLNVGILFLCYPTGCKDSCFLPSEDSRPRYMCLHLPSSCSIFTMSGCQVVNDR